MSYTKKDICKIIENLKSKAPIVRHWGGFIILAQSERDFQAKKNKIISGDFIGFLTVENAQKLINSSDTSSEYKQMI